MLPLSQIDLALSVCPSVDYLSTHPENLFCIYLRKKCLSSSLETLQSNYQYVKFYGFMVSFMFTFGKRRVKVLTLNCFIIEEICLKCKCQMKLKSWYFNRIMRWYLKFLPGRHCEICRTIRQIWQKIEMSDKVSVSVRHNVWLKNCQNKDL